MKTFKRFITEQSYIEEIRYILEEKDIRVKAKLLLDMVKMLEGLIKKTKDKQLRRKYTMQHALLKRELFQMG